MVLGRGRHGWGAGVGPRAGNGPHHQKRPTPLAKLGHETAGDRWGGRGGPGGEAAAEEDDEGAAGEEPREEQEHRRVLRRIPRAGTTGMDGWMDVRPVAARHRMDGRVVPN